MFQKLELQRQMSRVVDAIKAFGGTHHDALHAIRDALRVRVGVTAVPYVWVAPDLSMWEADIDFGNTRFTI